MTLTLCPLPSAPPPTQAAYREERAAGGGLGRGRCLATWVLGLAVAAPLVTGATLALFLPAFFLLLLVRRLEKEKTLGAVGGVG